MEVAQREFRGIHLQSAGSCVEGSSQGIEVVLLWFTISMIKATMILQISDLL